MPGCVRGGGGVIDAWVCTRGLLLPPWVCIGEGGGYSCLCVVYCICMGTHWNQLYIFIRPNWIKIYGEEYHREEFVMTGFQEDDLHHLERLRILLLEQLHALLAVQLYRTNGINSHIAAYQVVATNNKTVILLSSLKNKQLYSILVMATHTLL